MCVYSSASGVKLHKLAKQWKQKKFPIISFVLSNVTCGLHAKFISIPLKLVGFSMGVRYVDMMLK
jgi:hypothetical protein